MLIENQCLITLLSSKRKWDRLWKLNSNASHTFFVYYQLSFWTLIVSTSSCNEESSTELWYQKNCINILRAIQSFFVFVINLIYCTSTPFHDNFPPCRDVRVFKVHHSQNHHSWKWLKNYKKNIRKWWLELSKGSVWLAI